MEVKGTLKFSRFSFFSFLPFFGKCPLSIRISSKKPRLWQSSCHTEFPALMFFKQMMALVRGWDCVQMFVVQSPVFQREVQNTQYVTCLYSSSMRQRRQNYPAFPDQLSRGALELSFGLCNTQKCFPTWIKILLLGCTACYRLYPLVLHFCTVLTIPKLRWGDGLASILLVCLWLRKCLHFLLLLLSRLFTIYVKKIYHVL